jgi:hypothetical protein
MINAGKYYKSNMLYFRAVLGIAHHKFSAIGRLFRDKNLSSDEKLEIIERIVNEYKEERFNYPNPIKN